MFNQKDIDGISELDVRSLFHPSFGPQLHMVGIYHYKVRFLVIGIWLVAGNGQCAGNEPAIISNRIINSYIAQLVVGRP